MIEWDKCEEFLLAVTGEADSPEALKEAAAGQIARAAELIGACRIEVGDETWYDSGDCPDDVHVITGGEEKDAVKCRITPKKGCAWTGLDEVRVRLLEELIRLAVERAKSKQVHDKERRELDLAKAEEEKTRHEHEVFLAEIARAMDEGEIVTYYQPKVDIRTNGIIGAEALVRWIRDGKVVSPGTFIPQLETTDDICKLDLFIFESVCKDIRKWIDKGLSVSTISSNFSMKHLKNEHFTQGLKEIAEKYSVPLGHLEIEMTETMNPDEVQRLLEVIRELRELGFRTALDDFGSGYSSLSLLKEIPMDVIKLDKSLLSRQHDFTTLKNHDKVLMRHIVGLTKDMQMMALAEGVETEEQRDFLKSIGCNYVQGFLYDRPLPAEEFEKRLRDGKYHESHNANPQAEKKTEDAAKAIKISGKVLIAEDNEINREITVSILESLGVEVDTAEDGSEALIRFMNSGTREYACVLMDIQMPVMDGYQSCRAIRMLDRTDAKDVPIIAITVDAYKETQEQALAAGMTGYVTKPLDAQRLTQVLENL